MTATPILYYSKMLSNEYQIDINPSVQYSGGGSFKRHAPKNSYGMLRLFGWLNRGGELEQSRFVYLFYVEDEQFLVSWKLPQ